MTVSKTLQLLQPGLINKLFDKGANKFHQDLGTQFQTTLASRLRRASLRTPYAKGSIGTKQRVTRRIRGISPSQGGATFGVDSGAFRNEITTNLDISTLGAFTVFSDLAYAGMLSRKFEEKGPFIGEGLYQFESADVDFAETQIGNMIDAELG